MAAANMHVTKVGAGAKTGATWGAAMDWAAFITDITGAGEAGDHYYLAAEGDGSDLGTLTGDLISNVAGTNGAEIHVIGVKNGTTNEGTAIIPADWGIGTDRPKFNGDIFQAVFANYHVLYNLRAYGTDATATLGSGAFDFNCIYNCEIINNGNGVALQVDDQNRILACDLKAPNSYALYSDIRNHILFTRAYDSDFGIRININSLIGFCIIDTSATDAIVMFGSELTFLNNTIYKTGRYAFNAGAMHRLALINNAVHGDGGNEAGGYGFHSTLGAIDYSTIFLNNNWYDIANEDITFDSGTTEHRATIAPSDTIVDPQHTNAGGGDFSWSAGGNLEGIAYDMLYGVG